MHSCRHYQAIRVVKVNAWIHEYVRTSKELLGATGFQHVIRSVQCVFGYMRRPRQIVANLVVGSVFEQIM